jgi:translation initiation factor IF-2
MNVRMCRTTACRAGHRATARLGPGPAVRHRPGRRRGPAGALTAQVRRVGAGPIRGGSIPGGWTAPGVAASPRRPVRAAAGGPRRGPAIRPAAGQETAPRHAGRRPSPASPSPERSGPEPSSPERSLPERSLPERSLPERSGHGPASPGRTASRPCPAMPGGHRQAAGRSGLAGPGRQETRGDRRARRMHGASPSCKRRRPPGDRKAHATPGDRKAHATPADRRDRAAGARCAGASGSASSPPPP